MLFFFMPVSVSIYIAESVSHSWTVAAMAGWIMLTCSPDTSNDPIQLTKFCDHPPKQFQNHWEAVYKIVILLYKGV
jgi:hypothetical protein